MILTVTKKTLIILFIFLSLAFLIASILNNKTSFPTEQFRDQLLSKEAKISFPIDEYPHDNVTREWWYFSGHLIDQYNNIYGLMHIVFRNGDSISVFIDKANEKYYSYFKTSPPFSTPQHLLWENRGDFTYSIMSEYPELSYFLTLTSNKKALLIGDNGLTPFGKEGYSYYYSLTDLDVYGTLSLNNNELLLKGKGWIDRQWGNWDYGADVDSWEWFSIRLDNGVEIAVFNIMLNGNIIQQMFNLIDRTGKSQAIDNYEIEYENAWKDSNGYSWNSNWFISSTNENNDIALTAALDFKDQFFRDGGFEGIGTVDGVINGEKTTGVMFYEKLYFY